mgnify:CR=1 FL=1
MAQATSYNVAGVREDLSNALTVLSPEDTPFLSSTSKGAAPGQTYQEWQVDDYEVPAFAPIPEGQDVSSFANKSVNRARIGNYIQKFRREWAVSDLLELSNVAGVDSEVANAKAKVMVEIKRDMESALCSDNDRDNNPVTGTQLRALGDWIDTAGPSDVPAAYRTLSGAVDTTATGSLTEAQFNAPFQAIYNGLGSKGDFKLIAGSNLKSAISNFQRATGSSGTTKTYQVTQDASAHKIDLTVSVYEGDFHYVTVIPTVFNGLTSGGGFGTNQSKARGYILNPSLVSVNFMKSLGGHELQNEGGGRRGYVDAILTLAVKNPKGLGKFAGSS